HGYRTCRFVCPLSWAPGSRANRPAPERQRSPLLPFSVFACRGHREADDRPKARSVAPFRNCSLNYGVTGASEGVVSIPRRSATFVARIRRQTTITVVVRVGLVRFGCGVPAPRRSVTRVRFALSRINLLLACRIKQK